MKEIKEELKTLLIVSIQLGILVIMLSYIREVDQRLDRIDNMIDIIKTYKTPNYYEYFKKFESIHPELKELEKQ